jgi:Tol biopolymer transport system component
MERVSLTPDGKRLFFNTGKKERLFNFVNLDQPEKIISISPDYEKVIEDSCYHPLLSPDGQKIVFTARSRGQEVPSAYYQYELFLMDVNTKNTTQLTRLGFDTIPRFFSHDQNKIYFLNDTNWPKKPEILQWMVINIDGTGLQTIDMPIDKS